MTSTQKLGIFNWDRDHSRLKKVLKQAGVVLKHSKSIKTVAYPMPYQKGNAQF